MIKTRDMKKAIFYLTGLLLILSACDGDEVVEMNVDFNNADLVITSGYVCGWCAGADSLTMIENAFAYVAFNPCNQEEVKAQKAGQLKESQWNSLMQTFDFDDFAAVDLNRCNVCVDGCDKWVKVKVGEQEHKITYGQSAADSAIMETIMPFIEQLDQVKAELTSE